MNRSEADLIASCQTGDLRSFDPLYEAYAKRIYAYVYRRTLHKQTAEDLTSTTFLKALEHIGSYSPAKGAFGAWLYRIARNAIVDHYRSHRPHEDIETVWDLSSTENVATDIADRSSYEEVRDALHSLKPAQREIVLLRVWEGLSYAEISSLLGKSESNCKVIFHRAIKDLRSSLPISTLLLLLVFPSLL